MNAPVYTVGCGNLADYSQVFFDNSQVAGSSGQAYLRHYANSHNDAESALAFGVTTTGGTTSERMRVSSTGIDVTGTVTADGFTVDGTGNLGTIGNGAFNTAAALGFQSDRAFFGYSSSQNALIQSGASKGVVVEVNSDTLDGGTRAALFASNGDVQLFEDTGTTAKFHWDASAESLRVPLSLYDNSVNAFPSEG